MGILDQFSIGFATGETDVMLHFYEEESLKVKGSSQHIKDFIKKTRLHDILEELVKTGCKSALEIKDIVKSKNNDKTVSTHDIIMNLLEFGESKVMSDSCYANITLVDTQAGFHNLSISFTIQTKFSNIDNLDNDIFDMCNLKFKTPYGEYNQ